MNDTPLLTEKSAGRARIRIDVFGGAPRDHADRPTSAVRAAARRVLMDEVGKVI